MNGKGDRDRTSNIKRYKENYDKIFGNASNITAKRQSRPGHGQIIRECEMDRNTRGN